MHKLLLIGSNICSKFPRGNITIRPQSFSALTEGESILADDELLPLLLSHPDFEELKEMNQALGGRKGYTTYQKKSNRIRI